MYEIFFIYSWIEGHLSCSQFLAIMNKAPMNTIEQESLWYDRVYFGHMLKNSIAKS